MPTSGKPPSWYHHFLTVERDEASGLYRILADKQRRVLLDILDQSDEPVTVPELARLVASRESGNAPDEVTSTAQEEVQTTLHHTHLPQLEAHELIERTAEGSITRTQHPFWTSSDLRTFLTQPDVAPATTTATLDSLTNRLRRAILAFLYEHRTTTVEGLAEELVDTSISGQEVSDLLVDLTHRHLPKLEAANAIEIDATGDRVRYTGNVVLEQWFTEVRGRR